MTDNQWPPLDPNRRITAGQTRRHVPRHRDQVVRAPRILFAAHTVATLVFAFSVHDMNGWMFAWVCIAWLWCLVYLVTAGTANLWHSMYEDLSAWHNLIMARMEGKE